jgi:RNA polymerase sigma-70 factor (ECF subfamily)
MSGKRQLDPKGLGDHVDRLYRAAWGLCGSREDAEDLRRAAARRPQTSSLPEDLQLVADRRAVRAESQLESAELFAAISALPEDFRDALIAIDVAGLSYREAALTLRVREATITTRLHRARQRIAQALGADEESGPRLDSQSQANR